MSVLTPFGIRSIERPTGLLFGIAASPMLLGTTSLALACGVARGVFHPLAVGLLVVALLLWIIALFPNAARRIGFESSSITPMLAFIIVLQVTWSAVAGTGLRDYLDVAPTMRLAPLIALLISIPLSIHRPILALGLSVLTFAFAVVTTIFLTPEPLCDVWMFQQGAAHSLVNGINPYHTTFVSPYEVGTPFYGPGVVNSDGTLSVSFPYPPASLLMVLPGFLLGDVRLALLAWLLIGVVAIALMAVHRDTQRDAGAQRIMVLTALILLSSPHALMLVLTGWTESILIGLVGLTAWCFVKRPGLAWIPLGLLLASKQYLIVLAPVMLLFLNRSTVMRALLVAIGLTLPFLYADREAFYRSVVEFHFIQPFRADGLTLAAFVQQAFGVRTTTLISALMVIAIYLILRRNLCRDAVMWFAGSAITLLAFFAFSKQAFGNYYMLALAFALAGLAMKLNRTTQPSL